MLRHIWTLLKSRMLFIVLSLVMIFPFDAIIDKMGFKAYSIFICLFYLPFVFLDSYKMASYDKKDYTPTTAHKYKGYLIGLLSELPSIVVLLLALIGSGSSLYQIFNLAYIFVMSPFLGFLGLPVYMSIYYFLALLFIPITVGVGYLLGYKEYELVENIFSKIIYADNKPKK